MKTLQDNLEEWAEIELNQAFERVELDVKPPRKSLYPLEVMTWAKHEKMWGEHQGLLRSSPDCDRFHALIQELQGRDPTDEELDFLLHHEETCVTGRHSDKRLEKDLGLPPGALRVGAPERGLLPPSVFASHLRKELARRGGRKRLRLASSVHRNGGTIEEDDPGAGVVAQGGSAEPAVSARRTFSKNRTKAGQNAVG